MEKAPILKTMDATQNKAGIYSCKSAIIKSRLESRQFTDYYNRAAEIDKLSNERKGEDEGK